MDRLIAIVALLFCVSSCTEDTWSWLCPVDAIFVDGQCEWTYSQISAGDNQTCAVRAVTGKVVCWGQGSGIEGWPTDEAFSEVTTRYDRTCGVLRDTGERLCWGGDELGYLGPILTPDDPAPEDEVFSMIVGDCGIRRDDRQLECWSDARPFSVPEGEMCSLAARQHHIVNYCALRCSGEIVCFPESAPTAALIPSDVRYSELAMGIDQLCAVEAESGFVTCWSTSETRAAAQPPRVPLEQLTMGAAHGADNRSAFYLDFIEHACALRRDDHRVVCWGDDYSGQVSGAPSFTRYAQVVSRTIPAGGHEPIETLICGLREHDGLVTCWGDDGGPARDQRYSAITTDCGILAANGRTDCLEVLAPDDALSEVRLSPDGLIACGLRAADHTAVCWFQHDSNSDDDARLFTTPANVALHNLVLGHHHACALRDSDNHVVCWGSDIGATISDAPSDVSFRQIQTDPTYHSSGGWPNSLHTCGIRESDGLIQCWGAIVEYPTPPRLPPAALFYQLAGDTLRGILEDTREIARIYSDGTIEIDPQVKGIRFRAVADTFTCGIREDDSRLTCWGEMIWNP